jgi:surfeit locus 1 family protein
MRGRRLIVLLAALAAAALTARLGFWQLDRAAQKLALQAAQDERRTLPPLAQTELARAEAAARAQHHRAVRLRGRWAAQATVYLDNRQMNGRPGFYVITPLVLDDGSAVAVQRGWLPRDAQERTRIARHETSLDEIEVQGRVAPPPARLYDFDGTEAGTIRQNLDLVPWGQQHRLLLRPLSVVQEGTLPPDGLLRQWPQPAAGVERHHGYAFQWFALSALVITLYVWFQLIRPRRRQRERPAG